MSAYFVLNAAAGRAPRPRADAERGPARCACSSGRPSSGRPVGRAEDAAAAAVEDVGVDHRRADVAMAEELLDGADVVPILQEMCGEGVAEGVACGGLRQAGTADGGADEALHDCLVEMVAAVVAAGLVPVHARGGEDPLPGPLAPGVGVFAFEGCGELDPAGAAGAVLLVLQADTLEVARERFPGAERQHGDAILLSFAAAHGDLVGAEVDVLHAQAQPLEES